jgi:hypothetical protein
MEVEDVRAKSFDVSTASTVVLIETKCAILVRLSTITSMDSHPQLFGRLVMKSKEMTSIGTGGKAALVSRLLMFDCTACCSGRGHGRNVSFDVLFHL